MYDALEALELFEHIYFDQTSIRLIFEPYPFDRKYYLVKIFVRHIV